MPVGSALFREIPRVYRLPRSGQKRHGRGEEEGGHHAARGEGMDEISRLVSVSGMPSISRCRIESAKREVPSEGSGGRLALAAKVPSVRSLSEVLQNGIAAIWSEDKVAATFMATLAFLVSRTGQGRTDGRLSEAPFMEGSPSAAGICVSTSLAARVPDRPI